ncbi:MAG: RrF2 family transcriptional regulator [Burkholderiales bacterium]
MRLTKYSDYSLRVLIYLGVHPGRLATINEIAHAYGISRNHLMKVVHQLGAQGYISTTRGKNGGMKLAHPVDAINLGDVVRRTEEDFYLVECFNTETGHCPIQPACVLQSVLGDALSGFFAVLDRYTLADVLAHPQQLARLLDQPGVGTVRLLRTPRTLTAKSHK